MLRNLFIAFDYLRVDRRGANDATDRVAITNRVREALHVQGSGPFGSAVSVGRSIECMARGRRR